MASSDPVPDPNFYTWPFQLTKTMHRNPNPAVLPSNPSNSQKGKIVIITGAYGGIGAGAAAAWARAGASVVLTGRDPAKLAALQPQISAASTSPSAKIVSVSVDIVSEPDVRALYAEIQKVFGRSADVLINNAGAKAGEGFLGDVVWDEFTRVVNTHFLGAALMARYFVSTQAHPKDPVGTIVYITSGIGGMMLPGAASYSIAKLAGQRLMEYMDAEYPHLRTFSLSPGIVRTAMNTDHFLPFAKDHAELPGMMALYLSTERADFLRGGFVGLNWDVDELEQHREEIVKEKLLKLQWLPARFGEGGHPFGAE